MADVSNRRVGNQYRQGRNASSYKRSAYVNNINGIDGNTARQLNAVPKRRERYFDWF